jgi:cytidylate kinase
VAPLRPAPDAIIVDTTALAVAEVVTRVCTIVREREAASRGGPTDEV